MAVHVEDVTEHHERIKNAGANPTDPARQPWGMTMFAVVDPDGFPWQVIEQKTPC